LWPHINLEDLSREKPLLCLLNTRARCPPTTFVDYEIEICRLGIDSRTIEPLQLNGYIIYMEGETTETYGKLVALSDGGNGFNNNSTAGFQPGDGLLILEIQQKVMDFLVRCCETILDKPAEALISQYPIQSKLPPVEDGSLWPTTEDLARYAPYLPPQRPNFNRLKALLGARSSAARDHILALKEDPAYFADVVYSWSEHRQEIIRDSAGKIHSSYGQTVFWDVVVTDVVLDAYVSLFSWDVASKQADHLATLHSKYARVINPRYMLPEEFMRGIQIFRALLLHFSNNPIASLHHGLPASPPLRSLFTRALLLHGNTRTLIRSGVDVELDPLLWIVNKMWDPSQRRLYGPQNLVDEMERLVFAEPQQHERISPWVATHFADLGLWVRIKHEVDSYQPWAAGFETAEESFKTDIETEFHKRFVLLTDMNSTIPNLTLGKVGYPCDEKFFYPSDKRLSKSNAQSMRKAEMNLDLFWQEVERQYEAKTGRGLAYTFDDLIPVNSEIERTPGWIESAEETPEKSEAAETTAQPDDLVKPMSNVELKQEKHSAGYTSGFDAYCIKARDVLPELNQAERLEEKDSIQPSFKLDNRAFRVFKALFYTPCDHDGPGEIAWADFLHAMSVMGFGPFKLYGSLWHFDNHIACPIQFHEPRPHSKISLRVAIRMGRRLKRAYGWHAAMFGLDKGKGK
jgi:hypothetical protein